MSTVWTDIFLSVFQGCLQFVPTQSEYSLSSHSWATPVCRFAMGCIFPEWSTVRAQVIICSVNKTRANLKGKGKGTWANLREEGSPAIIHWNKLPRGLVRRQSLEMHKAWLDTALSNLPWAEDGTWWSSKIPSHLNYSVRLSRSNSKM